MTELKKGCCESTRKKTARSTTTSLGKLLRLCGDVSSPLWQWAWNEFYAQYDGFIREKILEQCSSWRVSRLPLQFSETVLDIKGKVYFDLCKNDCKPIRGFRGGDNEKIFRAWLRKICYNTTKAHLGRYFKDSIVENDLDSIKKYVKGLDFSARWELFDSVVKVIESNRTEKKGNKERDINIFLLYVWADFNSEMMSFHPFLKTMGHRVVDNVVSRTRKQLCNNRALVH